MVAMDSALICHLTVPSRIVHHTKESICVVSRGWWSRFGGLIGLSEEIEERVILLALLSSVVQLNWRAGLLHSILWRWLLSFGGGLGPTEQSHQSWRLL